MERHVVGVKRVVRASEAIVISGARHREDIVGSNVGSVGEHREAGGAKVLAGGTRAVIDDDAG